MKETLEQIRREALAAMEAAGDSAALEALPEEGEAPPSQEETKF